MAAEENTNDQATNEQDEHDDREYDPTITEVALGLSALYSPWAADD